MGIFNFFFSKNSTNSTPSNESTGTRSSHQSFSTPFMKIGKGDLTRPHINTYYTIAGGFVRFGADNLYPQILNQLYFQSSIHGACIDFIVNSTIGGGWKWHNEGKTAKERVDILTHEKKLKMSSLIKQITRDIVIHNRVTLLITQNGENVRCKRLDPSTIRQNVAGDKVIWSPDWSRGEVGAETYPVWYPGCRAKERVFLWQEDVPGQDVYSLPSGLGALNWAYLDSEQSFFHKQNIQNSVFPSIVIRVPQEFDSADAQEDFKRSIQLNQGAENGGKAIVLTGQGFDNTPEVVFAQPNPNDAIFTETAKECKEQICIAHKINPSIMGVKVAGSLGNAQELEMSYAIFEKNVVMPLRKQVIEVFDEIFECLKINNSIEINNYQIIEKSIEKNSPENAI